MLKQLNEINTHIDIKATSSSEFLSYGRIVNGFDFSEAEKFMLKESNMPTEGNVYVASEKEMEKLAFYPEVEALYGGMPAQIGYCNGNGSTLNGLEYHKGSEFFYAVTDLVLLLGKVQDIQNETYDSKNVEAFYVEKGTALELYQTTLHFGPCKVSDAGFKSIIILPKGTNEALEKEEKNSDSENKMLFMKNKWLLVHPSRDNFIQRGAVPGIIGENIEVKY